MSAGAVTTAQLHDLIQRSPYQQWLGLQVLAFAEDRIEVKAVWQHDWMANAERKHTHGGIVATLVDFGAAWALAWRLGHAAIPVDLRIDYHRPAMPGDLRVQGRVVKSGSQFAVCEAQVFNSEDKLAASGRGTYLVKPPD